MDYKELIWKLQNDVLRCETCNEAANAIIELLARAESAEARAKKAEKERNTYKDDLEFYKEGCHRLSLELDQYEYADE